MFVRKSYKTKFQVRALWHQGQWHCSPSVTLICAFFVGRTHSFITHSVPKQCWACEHFLTDSPGTAPPAETSAVWGGISSSFDVATWVRRGWWPCKLPHRGFWVPDDRNSAYVKFDNIFHEKSSLSPSRWLRTTLRKLSAPATLSQSPWFLFLTVLVLLAGTRLSDAC